MNGYHLLLFGGGRLRVVVQTYFNYGHEQPVTFMLPNPVAQLCVTENDSQLRDQMVIGIRKGNVIGVGKGNAWG